MSEEDLPFRQDGETNEESPEGVKNASSHGSVEGGESREPEGKYGVVRWRQRYSTSEEQEDQSESDSYSCPKCGSDMENEGKFWRCTDCESLVRIRNDNHGRVNVLDSEVEEPE